MAMVLKVLLRRELLGTLNWLKLLAIRVLFLLTIVNFKMWLELWKLKGSLRLPETVREELFVESTDKVLPSSRFRSSFSRLALAAFLAVYVSGGYLLVLDHVSRY